MNHNYDDDPSAAAKVARGLPGQCDTAAIGRTVHIVFVVTNWAGIDSASGFQLYYWH